MSIIVLVCCIFLLLLKLFVNGLSCVGYELKYGTEVLYDLKDPFSDLVKENRTAAKDYYLIWWLFSPIRRLLKAMAKGSSQELHNEDV